jgi:hypothetical protein
MIYAAISNENGNSKREALFMWGITPPFTNSAARWTSISGLQTPSRRKFGRCRDILQSGHGTPPLARSVQ